MFTGNGIIGQCSPFGLLFHFLCDILHSHSGRVFLSLQWEELKAAKPAEGEEDPDLLEEIAEARKNLGQFIRKTSPEYEPEGAPPARAEQQRARLVGLLGTVQREKGEFNEMVVAMRGRKGALIGELAFIADQVCAIQRDGLDRTKWREVPRVPSLAADEKEKDLLEIDELEVNKLKAELIRRKAAGPGRGGGGKVEQNFRSSPSAALASGKMQQFHVSVEQSSPSASEDRAECGAAVDGGSSEAVEVIEDGDDEEKRSKMELEAEFVRDQMNQHEQDTLINRMEALIDRFDLDLTDAVEERRERSVRLKYAELRMISVYEELQVLAAAQIEEDEKLAKVDALRAALNDIDEKLGQKDQEMASLAEERSKYTECLKSLHVKMEKELVDNKHAKYLAKLFNLRRGKKSKKAKLDRDERYLCPHGNEQVEAVDLEELRGEADGGQGGNCIMGSPRHLVVRSTWGHTTWFSDMCQH